MLADQRLPTHDHDRNGARRVLAGAGDEPERVAEEVPGVEGVADVAHHEAEIEVAVGEAIVEDGVVVALERDDVEIRQLVANGGDQRGQHRVRHALKGPDPEASGVAGAEPVEVGVDAVEVREELSCVVEQVGAERGEFDGSRTAGTIEDGVADDPFERRDLLADGGLGVTEPFSGATEGAFGGDSVQRHQQADVEVAQTVHTISVADHHEQ